MTSVIPIEKYGEFSSAHSMATRLRACPSRIHVVASPGVLIQVLIDL